MKPATGDRFSDIAVTLVAVDEEQARRILLIDNRTNDLGYDPSTLVDVLAELDGLEGHRTPMAGIKNRELSGFRLARAGCTGLEGRFTRALSVSR